MIFTTLALIVLLVASPTPPGCSPAARTRRRETAVRLPIGAGRGWLIRLLLTEGLVLALRGPGRDPPSVSSASTL